MPQPEATRDISSAAAAKSRSGKTLIKVLETVSGRHGLIRRAAGYEREVAQGRSFRDVMPERDAGTFWA